MAEDISRGDMYGDDATKESEAHYEQLEQDIAKSVEKYAGNIASLLPAMYRHPELVDNGHDEAGVKEMAMETIDEAIVSALAKAKKPSVTLLYDLAEESRGMF